MGKFMSQDVMKRIVQNIDNLGLGGKKATLTVLFSDIRGFTSMSEQMSAQDVSEILNEYFTEMEGKNIEEEKLIMKYIDTEGCEFIPITEYENNYLRENYLIKNNDELGVILNRSPLGIAQHLWSLNLYRPTEKAKYQDLSEYIRKRILPWTHKIKRQSKERATARVCGFDDYPTKNKSYMAP